MKPYKLGMANQPIVVDGCYAKQLGNGKEMRYSTYYHDFQKKSGINSRKSIYTSAYLGR